MSPADHKLIANAIKATEPPRHHQGASLQHEWTAAAIATALALDCPLFNRDAFLAACISRLPMNLEGQDA